MNKLIYILSPIILAILINGVIFTSGWSMNRDPSYSKLPPGWVVGTVWTIILGFLGYVSYLVRNDLIALILILTLIFLCLTYPFYTQGLADMSVMRVANFSILLYSIFVTFMIFIRVNSKNSLYIIPLLAWLIFVNVIDSL